MPVNTTPFKYNQKTLNNKSLDAHYALPTSLVEELASLNLNKYPWVKPHGIR